MSSLRMKDHRQISIFPFFPRQLKSKEARKISGGKPVHAVYGGLHLLSLTDQKLAWTGSKMSEFGVQHLLGAHCTGINAVNLLRDSAGLRRDTSVVGAVGSVFTLEDGIRLGALNR